MKTKTKKAASRTVDMTPTWRAVMPILYTAAANGSESAIIELNRVAAQADAMPAVLAALATVTRQLANLADHVRKTVPIDGAVTAAIAKGNELVANGGGAA